VTKTRQMTRRQVVSAASSLAAGAVMFSPFSKAVGGAMPGRKVRLAMVGTGIRGAGMWGKNLLARQSADLSDLTPQKHRAEKNG
jgi:hypothetical protein